MREQRGLPLCHFCLKIVYIKSFIWVNQCSQLMGSGPSVGASREYIFMGGQC